MKFLRQHISGITAGISLIAIAAFVFLRYGISTDIQTANLPLYAALVLGGIPLVIQLFLKLIRGEFGSDLLAGISIVTSVLLGEYLAGSIVVLMLSGGEALEAYALNNASSVLRALAKRMPAIAHKKTGAEIHDISLETVKVGDLLVVYPHDICPVDGVVVEGHGTMDESYLTGEPFQIQKTTGSLVISGAINGESSVTIQASHKAADSRYTKIMEVMKESEAKRPRLRRIGDTLGAFYTPVALLIAIAAWIFSGDPVRFLAVLVIATPCPLLIAIPITIIGSISLCARRSIIVKTPVVLEQISKCRTAIFDKTGTLTNGEPVLTELFVYGTTDRQQLLALAATLERYSKHPLAQAIITKAADEHIQLLEASQVSEPPGRGLQGVVSGKRVEITNRKKAAAQAVAHFEKLPEHTEGLECVIIVDNALAGLFRFRDAPRRESRSFIQHLSPKHQFNRVMILSGDRLSEVRYLAEQVGITDIYAQKTPEEKLAIVQSETAKARTVYVGDGINDAPAMMAATVGVAMGGRSDITTEAAGIVIMDNSLSKVDEFLHISRRMRTIALQSAIGGMLLSIAGMFAASYGLLTPVIGAIAQEGIDVLAVLNALRAALPPKVMQDHTTS